MPFGNKLNQKWIQPPKFHYHLTHQFWCNLHKNCFIGLTPGLCSQSNLCFQKTNSNYFLFQGTKQSAWHFF